MSELQRESPVVAEHADAVCGSLHRRMAMTVLEIDRKAARRVSQALAIDGIADDSPAESWPPGSGMRHVEPKSAVTFAHGPKITGFLLAAVVMAGTLALSRSCAHERRPSGSLLKQGESRESPAEHAGVHSMKPPIDRLLMVASLAAVTGIAEAQQAVQWRIQDGGNGHWYALHPTVGTWPALRSISESLGGHLVTLTTVQEWAWIKANFAIPFQTGRFAGAYQDRSAPDFSEPAGGWRWVTGEPFVFDVSYMTPLDDFCGNQQIMIFMGCCNQVLDDIQDGVEPGCDSFMRQAIIEWSADCNNDGIVDYGQILSGQLADGDLSGVPDVCECPCDVFRDNSVNGIDLGVLLGQWGPTNQYTVTDFNSDGAVDGTDLGTLLAAWGPCPG
jgi:hypothetical protein